MEAVINRTWSETERQMSHVYVLGVPAYPKPLLITDAAINIYPALAIKRDIVRMPLIDLALVGVAAKVAILSALEAMVCADRVALDAVALCKWRTGARLAGCWLAHWPSTVIPSGHLSRPRGITCRMWRGSPISLWHRISKSARHAGQTTVYLARSGRRWHCRAGARVPILTSGRRLRCRGFASCLHWRSFSSTRRLGLHDRRDPLNPVRPA
jgi:hypothetical protein